MEGKFRFKAAIHKTDKDIDICAQDGSKGKAQFITEEIQRNGDRKSTGNTLSRMHIFDDWSVLF